MADNGNKRYYWLKLSEDFFRQKEIKKLRRIAGGDTYTVIYLKMLLRSMEDGGKLYYEGYESDFASELALDIDEDVENVKMTVAFLIANGILHENTASEFEITTAREMVGSEGGSARRMRKMRAVKAIADGEKRLLSQCDSDVTARDTDIDKEIEIDTDTEIDPERYKAEEEESAGACAGEVNPYGGDRIGGTVSSEPAEPGRLANVERAGGATPPLHGDGRGVGRETVERYASNSLLAMSATAMEEIAGYVDALSEEIVRHAIDIALDNGVRKWAYVRAILMDYTAAGVKSVAEAKAYDERKRKKNRPGGGKDGPYAGLDRSRNLVPEKYGGGEVL